MDLILTILSLITALAWTMVYILVIRRNYLEKTYGIPLAALGGNFAWELIFSLLVRPQVMDEEAWLWIGINCTWLVFDVIIVIQTFIYGPREKWPSKPFFYGALAAALIFGFAGVLTMAYQFQDWDGRWTSFVDNLMMSLLFINMLFQRGIRGQSIYIALSKLVGTLAIGLVYLSFDAASPLQWYLTLSILFFDILYATLLYQKIRMAGLSPWKRI
jgi:hypothetical protein